MEPSLDVQEMVLLEVEVEAAGGERLSHGFNRASDHSREIVAAGRVCRGGGALRSLVENTSKATATSMEAKGSSSLGSRRGQPSTIVVSV